MIAGLEVERSIDNANNSNNANNAIIDKENEDKNEMRELQDFIDKDLEKLLSNSHDNEQFDNVNIERKGQLPISILKEKEQLIKEYENEGKSNNPKDNKIKSLRLKTLDILKESERLVDHQRRLNKKEIKVQKPKSLNAFLDLLAKEHQDPFKKFSTKFTPEQLLKLRKTKPTLSFDLHDFTKENAKTTNTSNGNQNQNRNQDRNDNRNQNRNENDIENQNKISNNHPFDELEVLPGGSSSRSKYPIIKKSSIERLNEQLDQKILLQSKSSTRKPLRELKEFSPSFPFSFLLESQLSDQDDQDDQESDKEQKDQEDQEEYEADNQNQNQEYEPDNQKIIENEMETNDKQATKSSSIINKINVSNIKIVDLKEKSTLDLNNLNLNSDSDSNKETDQNEDQDEMFIKSRKRIILPHHQDDSEDDQDEYKENRQSIDNQQNEKLKSNSSDIDNSLLDELIEDSQDSEDSQVDQDSNNEKDNSSIIENDSHNQRSFYMQSKRLFDDEAEDEDEIPQNDDDLDEQAIAQELEASQFIASHLSSEEGEGEEGEEGDFNGNQKDILAIHQNLLLQDDKAQLDALINKFAKNITGLREGSEGKGSDGREERRKDSHLDNLYRKYESNEISMINGHYQQSNGKNILNASFDKLSSGQNNLIDSFDSIQSSVNVDALFQTMILSTERIIQSDISTDSSDEEDEIRNSKRKIKRGNHDQNDNEAESETDNEGKSDNEKENHTRDNYQNKKDKNSIFNNEKEIIRSLSMANIKNFFSKNDNERKFKMVQSDSRGEGNKKIRNNHENILLDIDSKKKFKLACNDNDGGNGDDNNNGNISSMSMKNDGNSNGPLQVNNVGGYRGGFKPKSKLQ